MANTTYDAGELKKLTRDRNERREPVDPPKNGISTPSRERVREAVREANDPKRLISEPNNFTRF